MKRERLCNLRTKTQKARRIENGVSKSTRERRVILVGAEQRDLPPVLRRNWELDLQLAQAPRRIANATGVKEQVNRLVAEYDRERVRFSAARYDNGGGARLERAELGQRRTVDNFTVYVPLEISTCH